MLLFHGGSVAVERPRILAPGRALDFGWRIRVLYLFFPRREEPIRVRRLSPRKKRYSTLIRHTPTYADNVDVGTDTVTATGVGSYTGAATATFRIVRSDDPESSGVPESDPVATWPANTDHWVDWGDGTLEGASWYVYRNGRLCRDCWVELGGAWYYLKAGGEMWVDRQYLDYQGGSGWYFFNPLHDGTYGKMRTGWFKHQGSWYYMEPKAGTGYQGMVYASRTATIGGRSYTFDAQGRCVNP